MRFLRKLGYYSEREAIRSFRPEAAAFQIYCQYFGPDDIVVEAGAFRGYTTIGLLVKLAKFVYAFEPNPDNFKHLEKNTKGFETRLRLLNLGLGDHDELAEMRGSKSGASFVYRMTSSGAKGRIVTLDSLNLNPSPTVLILDCEGMETEAIKGAEKTIGISVHSILVETHHLRSGDTEPRVKDILSQLGFADIQTRQTGWNKQNARHDRWVVAQKATKMS